MGRLPTNILTSDSNVLTGIASAMSLGGNFYQFNNSRTPEEADFRAIYHDWRVVGEEIRQAMQLAASEGSELSCPTIR